MPAGTEVKYYAITEAEINDATNQTNGYVPITPVITASAAEPVIIDFLMMNTAQEHDGSWNSVRVEWRLESNGSFRSSPVRSTRGAQIKVSRFGAEQVEFSTGRYVLVFNSPGDSTTPRVLPTDITSGTTRVIMKIQSPDTSAPLL